LSVQLENKYRYNKKAGALQEAYEEGELNAAPMRRRAVSAPASGIAQAAPAMASLADRDHDAWIAHNVQIAQEMQRQDMSMPAATRGGRATPEPPKPSHDGLDRTAQRGVSTMFFITVEEGQRVQVIERSGAVTIVEGPARVWRWGRQVRPMKHYVAHPGEFLIVRYRDGRQEHTAGPAHVWMDPRTHLKLELEEALPISDKEAVVVYSEGAVAGEVSRRIVYGPATFVPKPGEWLHSFSWHGNSGADGRKVPGALVFQKLWLMPDQMYHDVTDVRTADDAPLMIRLMIFFELIDIERMLVTTHDPIGDFINAAASDVIEFMSRHSFESFKENTGKLNDLATYVQLTGRADQCGYRISKVVYRGYIAPESLQQMHNQAIESRTRLQLQRATEEQAQQLEDYKLERRLLRDVKTREEERERVTHDLEVAQQRLGAQLEAQRRERDAERAMQRDDAAAQLEQARAQQQAIREHLDALGALGVDLTRYLTQQRADRVIELRGHDAVPHLHLDSSDID
jgi:hypothetical protein